MSTHMMSVHRETLARVPNAKVGRDSLEISIYGMEGVPAIVIQEKMISKLKKRRQILQDEIQSKMNLNQKLNPKNIKDLKDSNEFFQIFQKYTSDMETLAGIKYYYVEQPSESLENKYIPPPPPEEDKVENERKRDSKFKAKKLEEEKSAAPMIMKDEMKQIKHKEHYHEEEQAPKPVINLNISQKQKDVKKKDKQEIMMYVNKISPEEKIAKMDKYKYDEKKIMSRLKNLQMNIADRLNAFKTKH